MKRFILSLSVTAALLAGCTAELSNTEKLDLADEYLSEHGGEPNYRAVAYDLYNEVLDEGPDDQSQAVRAHFGVGMIGFLDLVQGVPKLLEPSPAEDGEESGEMPPADALAGTIDALVHEVIDRGIVQHFDVVRREKDFAFTFKSLAFPSTDPAEKPVDLSGEWDLGEIGALYGILQTAVGGVELVWAYNQVPETVLEAALSGGDVPEMPSNPAELPGWASEAAKAVGLDPLPWLQPAFGTLKPETDLTAIRARFDDGTLALADAFKYIGAEKDPQDDDVFPKGKYLGALLAKVLNSDDSMLELASGILPPEKLEELARLANASVHEDGKAFLLPDFVFELVDLVDEEGVLEPVSMRLPGFVLSSIFTNPITDLKDTKKGLLPYFDAKGEFVLQTEQEPYADSNEDGLVAKGEYEDKGVDGFVDRNSDGVPDDGNWAAVRPGAGNNQWNDPVGLNDETKTKPTNPKLGHKSPTGRMEPSNDVVDQIYLFFGDASFGGFLVATTTATDAKYQVDGTRTYENQDLMRMTSSVIWFIDTLGFSL